MMTRNQYLLLKLSEECSEVAQRCSKQIQFGKDEIQKGQELTNQKRLHSELVDLTAIIQLLNEAGEITPIPNLEELIEQKKEKIKKYLRYSQELQLVEKSIFQCKKCSVINYNLEGYEVCQNIFCFSSEKQTCPRCGGIDDDQDGDCALCSHMTLEQAYEIKKWREDPSLPRPCDHPRYCSLTKGPIK